MVPPVVERKLAKLPRPLKDENSVHDGDQTFLLYSILQYLCPIVDDALRCLDVHVVNLRSVGVELEKENISWKIIRELRSRDCFVFEA